MKISVNQVQCKRCGSIIVSEHSHDLKWCKCRGVAVDGGRDYLKRLTGDRPANLWNSASGRNSHLFVDNQLIQIKKCRFIILYPVQALVGIGLLYHMTFSL